MFLHVFANPWPEGSGGAVVRYTSNPDGSGWVSSTLHHHIANWMAGVVTAIGLPYPCALQRRSPSRRHLTLWPPKTWLALVERLSSMMAHHEWFQFRSHVDESSKV